LLAGATGDADTWADGVGLVTGAIAALALTEFFVGLADPGLNRDSHGRRNTADFSLDAHVLLILQVAGLAEAADHALATAGWTRIRLGAGGSAGRAAGHEHLVLFALAHFWWIGEEHGWLCDFALGGRHAGTK
jgi:hypothetical protein